MIRIITDSASDYVCKDGEDIVTVIPQIIRFNGREYFDGVDISREKFFEMLIESTELPRTTQVTPVRFEEVFNKYKDDEIICITMTSKLSGSFQSAMIASEDFDNVSVIDSESFTVGEKILIDLGVRLIKEGKSKEEVVKTLNEEKKHVKVLALLDTLEYARKGGRISGVKAALGTFFNVKPVVELIRGDIRILGKARGSKMGSNRLREKINEYGGIDFSRPFSLAYSGLSDELLKKYIEDSKDLYDENLDLDITLLGSTIGTHIGPGAIGVAFYSVDKSEE